MSFADDGGDTRSYALVGLSPINSPVSSPASPEMDDQKLVVLDVSGSVDLSPGGRRESDEQIITNPTFVALDMINPVKSGASEPPNINKLYYLAACFFVAFAAFLPAQSLITTVFGSSGFWGLFLLYFSFTISTFYATLSVKWLGVRQVLFVSSCVYVAFIAACIPAYIWRETSVWIFFVACVVLGSVGGPFWVAQGVYVARLTQYTPEVIGHFNGTFLGIFFGCAIVGNLLTAGIGYLFDPLPVLYIFYALLVISIIACIMFIFITDPPPPIQSDPPVRELFIAKIVMLKEKSILFMLPYFFYVGVTVTFAWGKLPQLLPNQHLVPVIACVYGIGNLICSFVIGRVYDLYGWMPLAGFNVFIVVVAYSSIAVAYQYEVVWLFFLASALCGAFEGLGNSLSLSTVMKCFPNQASTGLFYYRFASGFGTAVGFVVGYLMPYNYFMFSLGVMCGATLLVFAYYFLKVQPEEQIAKAAQFVDDAS